ncbi:glycosyl transferase family A [Scytonema hofmannii PCC 7110]|uniref:Glycosyl transferase family A n=1 Tax=Scytonema hofmannii PCC 7110 TaxID=128403 RepID=A0A139X3L4_9CYAN|nr:glycosyltransferase [Scytonema hofmannii]KYC39250.1 glycosyl transferase family A [Scytonema hofmannii PCC 7110]
MSIVSVIVPAYNAERTILQTVLSIQKQSLSDLEIIIINDGSTDKTVELLNTVQDPRLKIFNYENGGLPVARNRGISHATGEYVAFIDADDLWTPDKLESQLAALEKHPDAGVAYSWTRFMDEKAETYHLSTPIYFEGDVYANLLVWNFIASGSNPLVRREAIKDVGEFDATLRSAEDWDYWLRLARRWHFAVVPKAQVLYRKSSGAMSSKIDVMEKYNLIVIDKAFERAPSHLQYLKKQSQAGIYQYMAQLALMYAPPQEKFKLSFEKIQNAIKLYPKLLVQKKTQILMIKLLLIKIFSDHLATFLMQSMSKIRATRLID